MGVQVETISPGDGKFFFKLYLYVYMSPVSTYCELLRFLIYEYFFVILGYTFPKQGQTVVVHYTGLYRKNYVISSCYANIIFVFWCRYLNQWNQV